MNRGVVIVAIGLLVFGFFYFGGDAEAPDNVPKPGTPDANQAAGGIVSFFDVVGDFVSSLNSTAWQIIGILVLVAILRWTFKSVPMIVWVVLAVIAAVLFAVT